MWQAERVVRVDSTVMPIWIVLLIRAIYKLTGWSGHLLFSSHQVWCPMLPLLTVQVLNIWLIYSVLYKTVCKSNPLNF
jgi:hypothetical protein